MEGGGGVERRVEDFLMITNVTKSSIIDPSSLQRSERQYDSDLVGFRLRFSKTNQNPSPRHVLASLSPKRNGHLGEKEHPRQPEQNENTHNTMVAGATIHTINARDAHLRGCRAQRATSCTNQHLSVTPPPPHPARALMSA